MRICMSHIWVRQCPQDVYKNYEACVGKLYGTLGIRLILYNDYLITPLSHS